MKGSHTSDSFWLLTSLQTDPFVQLVWRDEFRKRWLFCPKEFALSVQLELFADPCSRPSLSWKNAYFGQAKATLNFRLGDYRLTDARAFLS